MKKVYTLLVVLIFSLSAPPLLAQESGDYEYSREFLWGITKATNSGLIGGIILKHGRGLGKNHFQNFGLELVNIKHPQEERHYSNNMGNTFIWGKINYLYSIRLQYGREWVLFRKAAQQGVQISGIISGGPSIGLEAPYYIHLLQDRLVQEKVQFDPDRHNINNIIGSGNLLQGLQDSKVVPGLNLKTSLSFEFGTFKSNVVGFETGFMLEGFSREINILVNVENRRFFPNAFITLFYGSRR